MRRHHVHGLLHRDELAAAQAVAEEGGRVVGAAHAVEVGAGVGAADHGPRVAPDRGAHRPRGLVAVVGVGPQHGAQVVGQHDVEQGVEGRGAALGGDVGHAAEGAAVVGRRVGVADDVGAPVGQAAEHPGLLAAGALVQHGAHGGIGQLLHALVLGQAHHVTPARDEEERAVGAEAHVHRDERRHGQGDDPPAGGGGGGRGRELVLNALGRTGVDGEHVPVERVGGR